MFKQIMTYKFSDGLLKPRNCEYNILYVYKIMLQVDTGRAS